MAFKRINWPRASEAAREKQREKNWCASTKKNGAGKTSGSGLKIALTLWLTYTQRVAPLSDNEMFFKCYFVVNDFCVCECNRTHPMSQWKICATDQMRSLFYFIYSRQPHFFCCCAVCCWHTLQLDFCINMCACNGIIYRQCTAWTR